MGLTRGEGGSPCTSTELSSLIYFDVVQVRRVAGINSGGNTEVGTKKNRYFYIPPLSRGSPLVALLARGLWASGWDGDDMRLHLAIAFVVLVVDALHGDWLQIKIVQFCLRGLTKPACETADDTTGRCVKPTSMEHTCEPALDESISCTFFKSSLLLKVT